jgi:hypothetical protein
MASIATTFNDHGMAIHVLTSCFTDNDQADFISTRLCIFMYGILSIAGVAVTEMPYPLRDIMLTLGAIEEMDDSGILVYFKFKEGFTSVTTRAFDMDLGAIGVFAAGLADDGQADQVPAIFCIGVNGILAIPGVVVSKGPVILNYIVIAFRAIEKVNHVRLMVDLVFKERFAVITGIFNVDLMAIVVFAPIFRVNGEAHYVVTAFGIGMDRVLVIAGRVVAKIPNPPNDVVVAV